MRPTDVIPRDPEIPGLGAILDRGVGGAFPELVVGDAPVELRLRGYSRGSRATIEARAGDMHVAIKCYARDPAAEAGLYRSLADERMVSGGTTAIVPRLLAWRPELRALAISWLEGPSARELIAAGEGRRAGVLAAGWLLRAAALHVKDGPAIGAADVLSRTRQWATALGDGSDSLRGAADRIAGDLSSTLGAEPALHLVHGRFYIRHVLDTHGVAGIIDWDHFGQGPLEVDAGMLLATIWRSGQHGTLAREAARAEEAFLLATAGILDPRRLAWYRTGALLCLAYHLLARRDGDWLARAHGLLSEGASGLASVAASRAGRATRGPWSGRSDAPVAAPHPAGRRRLSSLNPLQLSVMQVLWARGEATTSEVIDHLDRPTARSTVTAMLGRLEREGFVRHRLSGRHLVHRAAIDQAEVRQSFVRDFALRADGLFEGDTAELVCQLVRARDVNAQDLARVIALLKAREQEIETGGER